MSSWLPKLYFHWVCIMSAVTFIWFVLPLGKRRYSIRLWKTFTDCFNCLPISAIIDEKIFCCHGGECHIDLWSLRSKFLIGWHWSSVHVVCFHTLDAMHKVSVNKGMLNIGLFVPEKKKRKKEAVQLNAMWGSTGVQQCIIRYRIMVLKCLLHLLNYSCDTVGASKNMFPPV